MCYMFEVKSVMLVCNIVDMVYWNCLNMLILVFLL